MDENLILKNIIERRRSIFPKDYSGNPIPQEVLDEVLHAATFAPHHKKTRPWRFKTFLTEEKMKLGEALASIYKETTRPEVFLEKKYLDIPAKINKAGAIVAICVNFSGLVPDWEEIAAVAMAVQNMYLTCTANNVGCYWSSPGITDSLRHFLSLEDNQKCLGFFYMGMV